MTSTAAGIYVHSKSIQPFSYKLLFWEYQLVHQPYGGLNHPGSHTDSQLLLQRFPLKVSLVTKGGLLPSWLAKATQCRAPTSTASLYQPTRTSSRTCWGAYRRQPCLVFPSVGIAPPHQPVSKLITFALQPLTFPYHMTVMFSLLEDRFTCVLSLPSNVCPVHV